MPDGGGRQGAVDHEEAAPDLGHPPGVADGRRRQIGILQPGQPLHQAHGTGQAPAKQAEQGEAHRQWVVEQPVPVAEQGGQQGQPQADAGQQAAQPEPLRQRA
ncbi:hypothetical protein D3C72_1849420 [compost metagenome]